MIPMRADTVPAEEIKDAHAGADSSAVHQTGQIKHSGSNKENAKWLDLKSLSKLDAQRSVGQADTYMTMRRLVPGCKTDEEVRKTSPASQTELETSKGALIPAKNADGNFPCPHCTKAYLHAKHLKRHLLRRKLDDFPSVD
jgi:hypothetical protein